MLTSGGVIAVVCLTFLLCFPWWVVVEAAFPFPPAKDVYVVLTVPDLIQLLDQPGLQHRHIVSILTPDLEHDPYATLYMGLLLDLLEDRTVQDIAQLRTLQTSYGIIANNDVNKEAFDREEAELPLNTTVIIFQVNTSELTIFEAGLVLLSVLPATSSFVSVQHGRHQIGLQHLQRYQSLLRLPLPSMLLHLNHERPWIVDYSSHLDFTFPSLSRLQEEYANYDLAVRAYFYAPLTGTAAATFATSQHGRDKGKDVRKEQKVVANYLPVFAPYQKFLVGNASSSQYLEAISRKASKRSNLCWFKGRIHYDYDQLYSADIVAYGVDGSVQNETLSAMSAAERYLETSSAEHERQKLVGLLQHHPTLSSKCTLEEKGFKEGEMFQVERDYKPYMEKLGNTAFSLCPAGNNPETFRLHESLEMGTIPILVRQQNADRDFLQHDYWRGYPGPVLSDWQELTTFFDDMTPERMDVLQSEVFAWYQRFKHRVRHHIRALMYDNIQAVKQREILKAQQTTVNQDSEDDERDYPRMVMDDDNQHFFLVRLDHFSELTGLNSRSLLKHLLANPNNEGIQNEDPRHILAMVQYDSGDNGFFFTKFLRVQPKTLELDKTKVHTGKESNLVDKAGLSVKVPGQHQAKKSPHITTSKTVKKNEAGVHSVESVITSDDVSASLRLQQELQHMQVVQARVKTLEDLVQRVVSTSEQQQDTIQSLQQEVQLLRNEKARMQKEFEQKFQQLEGQFAAMVQVVEVISQLVSNQ